MTRYAIDAPTLLHLVANDVQVSPREQIVAPNLIRSEALSLLFDAVRRGDLTEALALHRQERLTEMKMGCSVTACRAEPPRRWREKMARNRCMTRSTSPSRSFKRTRSSPTTPHWPPRRGASFHSRTSLRPPPIETHDTEASVGRPCSPVAVQREDGVES